MMRDYLRSLSVQNYSEHTISNREFHLASFIRWCQERGVNDPVEVTRPVLERYQRYLFHYRKKDGEPMSFRSQHSRLVPLRMWFRWMTRQNHLLHNPASELELPRLGNPLPRNIFSAKEVEEILQLCNIDDPIGLRDRATTCAFHGGSPVLTEIYLSCQVETNNTRSTCQNIRRQPPGEPLRPGGIHRRPRPGKLLGHQTTRRSRLRFYSQTKDLEEGIKSYQVVVAERPFPCCFWGWGLFLCSLTAHEKRRAS